MLSTFRTNVQGHRNSTGLLIGLLLGSLTGMGAMLLLTPQSGKETRVQIGQESAKLRDRVSDTFTDLVAMSHFDSRKLLAGPREQTEKR